MKNKTFSDIKKNNDDWWLSTKSQIIKQLIDNEFDSRRIKILDIASGTGFIAEYLQNSGYKNMYVSDKSNAALKLLHKKFEKIAKINLPDEIPINGKFDCVLILDVLEHIENDYLALTSIRQLIKKNGKIIITVPAFEFLWSQKDKRIQHKRRYTKATLSRLVRYSNLNINYISYYNFFLFPLAFVYSLTNKKSEKLSRYNKTSNNLFRRIFGLEIPIIGNKHHFPIGVSLIAVVSK